MVYTPEYIDREDVADALREEILTRYKATERPVLLSDLGSLRLEKFKYRSFKDVVQNRSLTDFLREFLGADFVLKRHPDKAQKIAVVPKSSSMEWSKWYDLPSKPSSLGRPRKIFERQFWNAFVTPRSPEKKRLIQVQAPFTFMDVPHTISIGNDYKEIQDQFLPSSSDEGPPHYQVILDNISKWLAAESLDEDDFLKKSEAIEKETTMTTQFQPVTQDAFLKALANLDSNDLHEVRVPLDVVLKAIRKIRPH